MRKGNPANRALKRRLRRNLDGLLIKVHKYAILGGIEVGFYVENGGKKEFTSYETNGFSHEAIGLKPNAMNYFRDGQEIIGVIEKRAREQSRGKKSQLDPIDSSEEGKNITDVVNKRSPKEPSKKRTERAGPGHRTRRNKPITEFPVMPDIGVSILQETGP